MGECKHIIGCLKGIDRYLVHHENRIAVKGYRFGIAAQPGQGGGKTGFNNRFSGCECKGNRFYAESQFHIIAVAAVHILHIGDCVEPGRLIVVAVLPPVNPLPAQRTGIAVIVQPFEDAFFIDALHIALDEKFTQREWFVDPEIVEMPAERRIPETVVVNGIEIECTQRIAAEADKAVVAVVVHLQGIYGSVDIGDLGECMGAVGNQYVRISAFNGTGSLVYKLLDADHGYMMG